MPIRVSARTSWLLIDENCNDRIQRRNVHTGLLAGLVPVPSDHTVPAGRAGNPGRNIALQNGGS